MGCKPIHEDNVSRVGHHIKYDLKVNENWLEMGLQSVDSLISQQFPNSIMNDTVMSTSRRQSIAINRKSRMMILSS